MKKLFFLAAALVISSAVMAQPKADELVKLNEEKHNFGKIKQGIPVSYYFEITNISNKPIVIENAWASCGCTVPEYEKQPITPGKTTKVKVQYNAASMGHFEKDVSIKLAGVEAPKVIKITGEVVAASKPK
jgi:hypothetical protein